MLIGKLNFTCCRISKEKNISSMNITVNILITIKEINLLNPNTRA